jgi:hypothetical protein
VISRALAVAAMIEILARSDPDGLLGADDLLAALRRIAHAQPDDVRRYAVRVYLRCRKWGAA